MNTKGMMIKRASLNIRVYAQGSTSVGEDLLYSRTVLLNICTDFAGSGKK